MVVVKRGSPENGGGTWFHPDLAVYLAQWCNKIFAIQVSRWVREWLLAGQNPIQATGGNLDKEWQDWQQRYDFRIELKDFLRPELMSAVAQWAEQHGQSPITLCSKVHDTMNERIQGAKAKQIPKFVTAEPIAPPFSAKSAIPQQWQSFQAFCA